MAELTGESPFLSPTTYTDIVWSSEDEAKKAQELWNLINEGYSVKAELCKDKAGKVVGWKRPIITGEPVSDKEISDWVLAIYQKTGKVVIDALMPGNVVKINNQLVCQDFRRTLAADDTHQAVSQDILDLCYPNSVSRVPTAIATTLKGIAFHYIMGYNRSAANPTLIATLAHSFDIMHPSRDRRSDSLPTGERGGFSRARSVSSSSTGSGDTDSSSLNNLEAIKGKCNDILSKYFNSRVIKTGEEYHLKPSITSIFRSSVLSITKAKAAENLMKQIRLAGCKEEIESILNRALTADEQLSKSNFKSGLVAAIDDCKTSLSLYTEQVTPGKF